MALRTPMPKDEVAAALEVMRTRIREMQDHERDPKIRAAYKVAADRLDAAIDRLRQPRPVVIGLTPKKPETTASRDDMPKPPPATKPVQRPLPLGPVALVQPPPRKRR